MPGSLDGFGLARRLRGRHPELPIILTSGNAARPDDMDGALFLPKPYDHQGLLQTIRRLPAARDRSKDDGQPAAAKVIRACGESFETALTRLLRRSYERVAPMLRRARLRESRRKRSHLSRTLFPHT